MSDRSGVYIACSPDLVREFRLLKAQLGLSAGGTLEWLIGQAGGSLSKRNKFIREMYRTLPDNREDL